MNSLYPSGVGGFIGDGAGMLGLEIRHAGVQLLSCYEHVSDLGHSVVGELAAAAPGEPERKAQRA